MKVIPIKGFGNLGVSITNITYPFIQSEMDEVSRLCREELVVVLSKINYTVSQFYELSNQIGVVSTHGQVRGVPTSHKTGYLDENDSPLYPGLDKVTGQKDYKGKHTGLAGGFTTRFNWHCAEAQREKINDVERPLPEIVGLHGVKGTKGTITQICQMVNRYEEEPEVKKQELKNTIMQWAFVDGDEAVLNVDKEYLNDDHGAGEETEWMDKKQSLVRKNISGRDGLHFSPSQVTGIVNSTDEKFKQLKEYIMTEYVQEKYIYDHVWQDGDIIFFDQEVSIHRRTGTNRDVNELTIDQLEKRLLHRIEIHIDKARFLQWKLSNKFMKR